MFRLPQAMLQYNTESKSIDLIVDNSYQSGEPVYAWCGPQPNSRLLINYGIVDEGNPFDFLQVTATLGNSDPLFAVKRQILLEQGFATQQVFRLQRGKSVPDPLLPFMRLAYLENEDAFHQVSFFRELHVQAAIAGKLEYACTDLYHKHAFSQI